MLHRFVFNSKEILLCFKIYMYWVYEKEKFQGISFMFKCDLIDLKYKKKSLKRTVIFL